MHTARPRPWKAFALDDDAGRLHVLFETAGTAVGGPNLPIIDVVVTETPSKVVVTLYEPIASRGRLGLFYGGVSIRLRQPLDGRLVEDGATGLERPAIQDLPREEPDFAQIALRHRTDWPPEAPR